MLVSIRILGREVLELCCGSAMEYLLGHPVLIKSLLWSLDVASMEACALLEGLRLADEMVIHLLAVECD